VHSNCIKNLLDLKDVFIKSVKNFNNYVEIHAELPISEQICPCCGSKTSKIHDHYIQPIKDSPIYFKPTTVFLKKTRYECKNCSKIFYPDNTFVGKYKRKSKRLIGYIIEQLRNNISASYIAKSINIDNGFVSKLLPYLAVTNSHLPRVLCIDEFKGNSGNYKYQVALLDGETHEIIDILECRHKHFLCDYFKKFPKEQLDNVKYLVTDLWESYKDIGITYFRKAKIVADHFHWARYACNALDKIRIETQSKLPKSERKYFKHSRKLLLSRKCNINEDKYDELENMLINYSENLRIAYREKECLLDILHSEKCSEIRKKQFTEWVKRNLESTVPQLIECAKTYQHWSYEIKNSLEVPYSNGPIEGTNNKIKALKRTTFGMPNFTNFKARIMLLN
jgi:transposase